VASLVARSPAEGLLPVTVGSVALSEAPLGPITGIAPFKGRAAEVSAALEAALGVGLPAPNRFRAGEGVTIVSTGPDQALVIGAGIAPGGAAVTDQSDAWAHLVLEGAGARDVLARLTPVDLRESRFAVGHAAQTLLFHMTATLMRIGPARWEILVFRSMARTAVHDLTEAMRSVAGRA
jgi:heterotetrameric sarcosine oxidase gamma subunit